MADETPKVPATVPQAGADPIDPDTGLSQSQILQSLPGAQQIGKAIGGRMMEPLKAEEIEKVPGLKPEDVQKLQDAGLDTLGSIFGKEKGAYVRDHILNGYTPEVTSRAALKTLTDWYSPAMQALSVPGRMAHGYAAAAKAAEEAGNATEAAMHAGKARLTALLGIGTGGAFDVKQVHDAVENWSTMTPMERIGAVSGILGRALITGAGAAPGLKKPLVARGMPDEASTLNLREKPVAKPAAAVSEAPAKTTEPAPTYGRLREEAQQAVTATAPEGSLEAGFAKAGGKKVLDPTKTRVRKQIGVEPAAPQNAAAGFIEPKGKFVSFDNDVSSHEEQAPREGFESIDDMMDEGWVRKAGQGSYEAGTLKPATTKAIETDILQDYHDLKHGTADYGQPVHSIVIDTDEGTHEIPVDEFIDKYKGDLQRALQATKSGKRDLSTERIKPEEPNPAYVPTLASRGQLPGQKVNLGEAYGDTGGYVGGLEKTKPVRDLAAAAGTQPALIAPAQSQGSDLDKWLEEKSGYHPDLQAVVKQTRSLHDDVSKLKDSAAFITPDGRISSLKPGAQHPDLIRKATGDTDVENRPEFLNTTGAIRTRFTTGRAGDTLAVSVPKDGVNPEQMETIKKAVGQTLGRYGNLTIERADVAAATKDALLQSKEFARVSDVEPMLKSIQAHPDQDLLMKEQQSPLKEPYTVEVTDLDGKTHTEPVNAFSSKAAIKAVQKVYPNAINWEIKSFGERTPSTEYTVPKKPIQKMIASLGRPEVHTIIHELGHALIGQREGMVQHGMVSNAHPDMPSDARAAIFWSTDGMYQEGTRIQVNGRWVRQMKPEIVPKAVRSYLGGIAADELFNNVPRDQNHNFKITYPTSDGEYAYRTLRNAGLNHQEALDRMNLTIDQNIEYLKHPVISGIIKENANVREADLSRHYHYSPERLTNMHLESERRLQQYGTETEPRKINDQPTAGTSRPEREANVAGGEGGSAEGVRPAAAAAEKVTTKEKLKPTLSSLQKQHDDIFNDPIREEWLHGKFGEQPLVARRAYNQLQPKIEKLLADFKTVAPGALEKFHAADVNGILSKAEVAAKDGNWDQAAGFLDNVLAYVHSSLDKLGEPDITSGESGPVRAPKTSAPKGAINALELIKLLSNLKAPGGTPSPKIPTKIKQNLSTGESIKDPETRFTTAHHEAGHAVLHELMNPGSVVDTGLTDAGGVTNLRPPAGKTNVAQLSRNEMQGYLAGIVAGGMMEPGGPTAKHVSGDTKAEAQAIGTRATQGNGSAMAQAEPDIAAARAKVQAALADPITRKMIDQVATQINTKGKLTGDEVRATIQSLTSVRKM